MAYRIKRAVEEERFHPQADGNIKVTVSIGVTQYRPTEDISVFVKRADTAMYQSKQDGRNRVTALFSE